MIKLEITAETPEQFRAQLQAFLPKIAETTVRLTTGDGPVQEVTISPETIRAAVGEIVPESVHVVVPEEQATRRKRRSKADAEPEATKEEPVKKEPEPELVKERLYAYSAASDDFFTIEPGEPVPTDATIAQGDLEFFESEQEWSMYKARHERQKAKKAGGVASKFEEEVAEEAEPKEVDGDALVLAVNDLLDAYGEEQDVAAGAVIKNIVTTVGKADRLRNVEPERRAAVLKALKAAIAEAPKKGKR